MSLTMDFKAPFGTKTLVDNVKCQNLYPKSMDTKQKVNSPKDISKEDKTIEDITKKVENLTFESDSDCDDPTPVVINGISYILCELVSKDNIPEDIMIYIFEELKSSDLKLITNGKKKGYYKFSPKSMKNPIYIKLEEV